MTYTYSGNSGASGEEITGTIYVSSDTYSEVGADPAFVVGEHMDDIMSTLLFTNPYTIYVMSSKSDAPSLSNEDVDCDGDSGDPYSEFQDYLYNDAPRKEDDFNLCITATKAGETGDGTIGCAGVGGNVAVSERGPQYENLNLKRYHSPTDGAEGLSSAIHEIGHNLGMQHGVGMADNTDADDDGDTEYTVTPIVPGDRGSDNVCGHYVEEDNSSENLLDMYYSSCALEEDDY